jgi:sulfide:quinone oxidoreductase
VTHRIVVVGAGTGGTMAANLLARGLGKDLRNGSVSLTVVGESDQHCFQPGNLDAAFRGAPPERFLRPQRPLLEKRVAFVGCGAARIDTTQRKVLLKDGGELPYDHLVLATGAEARQDLVPGLAEHTFTFHLGPQVAQRIWDRLKDFRGGHVAVAIAEFPYKCPPSPNEACFLLDEHLRKRGLRGKTRITLLTPYPRAYPAEKVSHQVEERFAKLGIGLGAFFSIGEAKPGALVSLEGDEFPCDLAIVVPPHRGARLITESGLGDKEGWVPTDKQTLRVPGQPGTYALGDCTDIPISKSGVVAHLQSLVVAKNVLADLGRGPGEWAYNGRINCPMEVGDHRLLFVSATYEQPPEEDEPTVVKFAMKKAFNLVYWQALKGRLEWMFRIYFGPTAARRSPATPGQGTGEAPAQK